MILEGAEFKVVATDNAKIAISAFITCLYLKNVIEILLKKHVICRGWGAFP